MLKTDLGLIFFIVFVLAALAFGLFYMFVSWAFSDDTIFLFIEHILNFKRN